MAELHYYFEQKQSSPHKIIAEEFEVNLENAPYLTPLTEEQVKFFKENPDASLEEVKNCILSRASEEEILNSSLSHLKNSYLSKLESLSLSISEKYVKPYELNNALVSLQTNNSIYTEEKSKSIIDKYKDLALKCKAAYKRFSDRIIEASSEEGIVNAYAKAVNYFSTIK